MAYEFLKVSSVGALKVSSAGLLIAGGYAPRMAIHSITIHYRGKENVVNNRHSDTQNKPVR